MGNKEKKRKRYEKLANSGEFTVGFGHGKFTLGDIQGAVWAASLTCGFLAMLIPD
jgi:hypothetical protein